MESIATLNARLRAQRRKRKAENLVQAALRRQPRSALIIDRMFAAAVDAVERRLRFEEQWEKHDRELRAFYEREIKTAKVSIDRLIQDRQRG